jgi:hypothetical protein
MKEIIKYILDMHYNLVDKRGLLFTALSYLILIVAFLSLFYGIVNIAMLTAGIRSISLLRIDF